MDSIETAEVTRAKLEKFKSQNGAWTAMSIHLGDGIYTMSPQPDARLFRLLQIALDLVGKPLDRIRVLDLACLEGHYGIEFAMHGCEVVALELRKENLAKAEFAVRHLSLDRIDLRQEDVLNLRREVHGEFDLVICSGILYHLDVPQVFEFVQRISEVCTRLAIFDTQIALSPRETVQHAGKAYQGLWYSEHAEGADEVTRLQDVWASVNNTRSFWFTHASLCNLVGDVGFSSMYECLNPYHAVGDDRRTYVAIKGHRAEVRSSPVTQRCSVPDHPEHNTKASNPIQIRRGAAFRLAKGYLPQPVKDRIKPLLRLMRILPPDTTPSWSKERKR